MAPRAAAEKVVLPPDLVRFLENGQLVCVATRTAALQPEYMDGLALKVEQPDAGLVRVYLPELLVGPTLANLRDNGQIAVTVGQVTDHRTLQLKGVMVDERPAEEEERAFEQQYLETSTRKLGLVGVPMSVCLRMVWWPSRVVRFEVHGLFEQTPGPGAGRRLDPAAPSP